MTIIQRGRYPEIELDKMKVEGDPEIVFFPQSLPFKKEDGYEKSNIQRQQTVIVDGEMFSWYGSRL
jgi:hypothetical protein